MGNVKILPLTYSLYHTIQKHFYFRLDNRIFRIKIVDKQLIFNLLDFLTKLTK